MIRNLLLAALFCLMQTFNAFAGWNLTQTTTQNALKSIAFYGTKGIAVGDSGIVLYSADNGSTWTKRSIAISSANAVIMPSAGTAIFVGSGGAIFKTVNGGVDWTLKQTGVMSDLSAIASFNSYTQFAAGAGGAVLKSTNSGENWTSLVFPVNTKINSIANPALDWVYLACDGGKIYRSTNGGSSWSDVSNSSNIAKINSIKFVTNILGFAVCDGGLVLKTTNGGAQWTAQSLGSQNLNALAIESSSIIYAGGSGGAIYKSTDGGVKWQAQKSNSSQDILSLFYRYSGALSGSLSGGAIISTEDGGIATSSITIALPLVVNYYKAGANNRIAWTAANISENLSIDYSTDGGTNWVRIVDSIPASQGYYDWNCPAISCNNTLIKIFSSSEQTISGKFSIAKLSLLGISSIKVLSQNQSIKWKADSALNTFKLYASYNSGASWDSIGYAFFASPKDTFSFQWTFPQKTCSDLRIMVREINKNISDTIYSSKITGLVVESPKAGEKVQVGIPYLINWNSVDVNSCRIDVKYGANDWATAVASAPATKGYSSFIFPIAAPLGTTKIRIVDLDINSNVYESGEFTLANLTLTNMKSISAVNQRDSIFNIKWKCFNLANVILSYRNVNSSIWTRIDSCKASLSSGAWNISALASGSYIVKIAEAGNLTNYDTSAVFTLKNLYFSQLAPNTRLGDALNIHFIKANINAVRIAVSVDSGYNWRILSDSFALSDYSWIPNDSTAEKCLIKVSDIASPEIYAISNIFALRQLNLLPSSGTQAVTGNSLLSKALIGSQIAINWTASPSINKVKLYYRKDNLSDSLIATANADLGSYVWTAPNSATKTGKYRIIIKDSSSTNISAISADTIIIACLDSVIVRSKAQVNSNLNVIWTPNQINNVNISLSLDGGATWIKKFGPIAGLSSQTITLTNAVSANACVKVMDADIQDSSIYSISNLFIVADIQFNNFKDRIAIKNNSKSDVLFSAINLDKLIILDSIAGGTWTLIDSITNVQSGVYSWTPKIAAGNIYIKICDAIYPNDIYAINAEPFSVSNKQITAISPNGGEKWNSRSIKTLEWLSDSVTNVKLYYTSDGAKTWNFIAETVATSKNYTWTLPNEPSAEYLFKIVDSSDSLIYDLSDSVFSVFGVKLSNIGLASKKFIPGETYQISWTSLGASSVKLQYKDASSTNWQTITASYPAGAGIYNWTIPNDLSDSNQITYKVRIVDNQNSVYKDTSANINVTLAGIVIRKPFAGETYSVGSTQSVEWDMASDSVATYVKIEFSSDSCATWTPVNNYCLANLKSFDWQIPDIISKKCAIRISSFEKPEYSTISDFFAVNGSQINISYPKKDAELFCGDSLALKWNSYNTESVNIYLSKKSGVWDTLIASNFPGSSYSFILPNSDYVSKEFQIKICDAENLTLSDSTGFMTLSMPKRNLWDVNFVSANSGWTVGEKGTLLKTTDGGLSWKSQANPLKNYKLNSCYFIDSLTGWVTGDSGKIIKTTNGGATWTSLISGTSETINKIRFANSNNGWAVCSNGKILRSADGGSSWTSQTVFGGKTLFALSAVNADSACAFGESGIIFKSTDDGLSWTAKTSPTANQLNGVYFPTVNTGYAIGNSGTIIKTTDGGATWVLLSSGLTSNLSSVYFRDSLVGYCAGENGVIIKTLNGGSNWTKVTTNTQKSLAGISFANNIGWAVGESGIIIKTSDGGATWNNSSSIYPPPSNWNFVSNTGENQIIIAKTSSNITIDSKPIKPNDVIGAFFTRGDSLVCAGYGKWLGGQNLAFTVWGDNAKTTTIKDGFAGAEIMTLRVWDSERGVVSYVNSANLTFESAPQKLYSADQISVISSLKSQTYQMQIIPIRKGWSMISANLMSSDTLISKIMDSVRTSIDQMKDDMGAAYVPAMNVNTIKTWNYQKGYQIYAFNDDTLYFKGYSIKSSDNPLPIATLKWQIIPYYPKFSLTPAVACSTISFYLLMLKNIDGEIYSPAYGINQIDSLRAGQGYKLISSYPYTTYLTYPDTASNGAAGHKIKNQILLANKYEPASEKTGNSMMLIVDSKDFADGDAIGIESANGVIYGSSTAQSGKSSITVWGANSVSLGAIEGEKLSIKLWKAAENKEYTLIIGDVADLANGSAIASGEISYSKDAALYATAEINAPNSVIESGMSDGLQIFPNPASELTSVQFKNPAGEKAIITIISALGEEVTRLESFSSEAEINLKSLNLNSGAYIIKVNLNGKISFGKMIISK